MSDLIPGEIRTEEDKLTLNNDDRKQQEQVVTNDGDRPIQIGSHFHFAEVNSAMSFDRKAAQGYHLDIAAGTSIRFEPGVSRSVPLIELGGEKKVPGLQINKDSKD